MSDKILNYVGDVSRAPKTVLSKMEEGGFEVVAWRNIQTNTRFVATKKYIEVMAENKKVGWREAKELPENEIRNLGTDLCTDEIAFEMMAQGVDEIQINEGFNEETKFDSSGLDMKSDIRKAANEFSAKKQNIKPVSIEQNHQDETTLVWFNVDGEDYAIADTNGAKTLLDSEGYPIDDCNDHKGIKEKLIPLYKKYSTEYCGQDCLIED